MKHLLINTLLFFASFSAQTQYTNYSYAFKQEPIIKIPTDEEINKAIFLYNKNNKQERELLYWTNFARKHPRLFFDEVVEVYINAFSEMKEAKNYAASLKRTMYTLAPLPVFVLDEKLMLLAREHSEDVKNHNNPLIAHNSTDGFSFQQRASRAGLSVCAGENLSYGASSTLMQLVLLFLDINQPNLGHRRNLLNPQYTNIGVSVVQLNSGELFFVQDFSCVTTEPQ